MKLSLVIPCFNEGENIPLLIKRLKEVFNSTNNEVILVNNGSSDNTQEVIEKMIVNLENFKVIEIKKKYWLWKWNFKRLRNSKW